jgi:hypothetical protein
MARGMIIEVDHLPRRVPRAFELLKRATTRRPAPTASTTRRLYAAGRRLDRDFGRCQDADRAPTMDDGFQRAASS